MSINTVQHSIAQHWVGIDEEDYRNEKTKNKKIKKEEELETVFNLKPPTACSIYISCKHCCYMLY